MRSVITNRWGLSLSCGSTQLSLAVWILSSLSRFTPTLDHTCLSFMSASKNLCCGPRNTAHALQRRWTQARRVIRCFVRPEDLCCSPVRVLFSLLPSGRLRTALNRDPLCSSVHCGLCAIPIIHASHKTWRLRHRDVHLLPCRGLRTEAGLDAVF